MYSLCVLLLVYNFICIVSGINRVTNLKGMSVNEPLLDLVRQNLRRNNDDYADITIDLNNFTNTNEVDADHRTNKEATETFKEIYSKVFKNRGKKLSDTEVSQEGFLSNIDKHKNRDIVNPLTKTHPTNKKLIDEIVTIKIMPLTKDLNKVGKSCNSRTKIESTTSKSGSFRLSQENVLKNQNITSIKNKMNAFKSFLLRNKETIVNSVSKAYVTPFLDKHLKHRSKGTANTINPWKINILKMQNITTSRVTNYINKFNLREEEKKNIGRDGEYIDNELPNPNSLDMAPAKGAQINNKRLKGRLCDRLVLFPEGPKYDSNGRWYLPEHAKVISQSYVNTRSPAIILPRCCNCCKKSVLGCE